MTTMDFEDFVKLGFNKNEAIVYVALAGFGTADAKQLIKETGFHKNIVYDNLEKLIEKGVVSYIISDGRRIYKIEPPDTLVNLFETKEKQVQAQITRSKQLAEEIRRIKPRTKARQEATMFKGIAGIKTVLNDQLTSGQDYISFGAPRESVDILGEHYWRNFRAKQAELGQKGKLLFNESLRYWGKEIPKELSEVRYLKNFSEPLTQTVVYGNKTIIIVWSEKPAALLIEDRNVADSYKEFFRILWKQAKE